MTEPDPLDSVLREWQAPDPPAGLDREVLVAYRSAVPRPAPFWHRFWTRRISLPAPALLAAAIVILGLFIWLRPLAQPSSPDPSGVVTQLNATGFQPLPNGDARVIPAMEVQK
jgi:hypothetical protein